MNVYGTHERQEDDYTPAGVVWVCYCHEGAKTTRGRGARTTAAAEQGWRKHAGVPPQAAPAGRAPAPLNW